MNVIKVNGKISIKALIISILITEGLGYLSSFSGMINPGFYVLLKKPVFSPPVWVFPIVWTILYLLMAFSAYRVWLKGQNGEFINKAVFLYILQLALNFLWSFIFFKFQLFGLAFIELMFLLIFVLLTTFEFLRIDKLAGVLMVPYILWIAFAGVINYVIWMLNEA